MNKLNRYDSLFQFYAELTGLPWQLLKAQAIAESNLDPHAESPAGAQGLCQFMPRTWTEWRDGTAGVQPLTDDTAKLSPWSAEDSIHAQATMMKAMIGFCRQQLGSEDPRLAWACYNWGMGNIQHLVEQQHTSDFETIAPHLPEETRQYAARIHEINQEREQWA